MSTSLPPLQTLIDQHTRKEGEGQLLPTESTFQQITLPSDAEESPEDVSSAFDATDAEFRRPNPEVFALRQKMILGEELSLDETNYLTNPDNFPGIELAGQVGVGLDAAQGYLQLSPGTRFVGSLVAPTALALGGGIVGGMVGGPPGAIIGASAGSGFGTIFNQKVGLEADSAFATAAAFALPVAGPLASKIPKGLFNLSRTGAAFKDLKVAKLGDNLRSQVFNPATREMVDAAYNAARQDSARIPVENTIRALLDLDRQSLTFIRRNLAASNQGLGQHIDDMLLNMQQGRQAGTAVPRGAVGAPSPVRQANQAFDPLDPSRFALSSTDYIELKQILKNARDVNFKATGLEEVGKRTRARDIRSITQILTKDLRSVGAFASGRSGTAATKILHADQLADINFSQTDLEQLLLKHTTRESVGGRRVSSINVKALRAEVEQAQEAVQRGLDHPLVNLITTYNRLGRRAPTPGLSQAAPVGERIGRATRKVVGATPKPRPDNLTALLTQMEKAAPNGRIRLLDALSQVGPVGLLASRGAQAAGAVTGINSMARGMSYLMLSDMGNKITSQMLMLNGGYLTDATIASAMAMTRALVFNEAALNPAEKNTLELLKSITAEQAQLRPDLDAHGNPRSTRRPTLGTTTGPLTPAGVIR